MMERIRQQLHDRPLLSGGLTALAIALALVVLFVAGVSVGRPFFRGKPVQGLPPDHPPIVAGGGDSSTTAGQDTSGGASPSRTSSAAPAGVSAGVSGQAAGASAAVASDIKKGSKAPASGSPAFGLSTTYLAENFGVGIVPPTAAGLRLTRPAQLSGDTVTGFYNAEGSAPVDSLRLVVVKSASPSAATKASEGLLAELGTVSASYSWGGRKVQQSMTLEGRPDQYPPVVGIVWTQGSYSIQVTVIPTAPGRVSDARDAGLALVSALLY